MKHEKNMRKPIPSNQMEDDAVCLDLLSEHFQIPRRTVINIAMGAQNLYDPEEQEARSKLSASDIATIYDKTAWYRDLRDFFGDENRAAAVLRDLRQGYIITAICFRFPFSDTPSECHMSSIRNNLTGDLEWIYTETYNLLILPDCDIMVSKLCSTFGFNPCRADVSWIMVNHIEYGKIRLRATANPISTSSTTCKNILP